MQVGLLRRAVLAACDALEASIAAQPLAATTDTMDQGGITAAVAWQFIQATAADLVPAARYPALAAYSAQAEALPDFIALPPV